VAAGGAASSLNTLWEMTIMRMRSAFIALSLTLGLTAALPALAQTPGVKTSFIRLGPGVPGVLYEPLEPGPKSRIAVYVMHASNDYLQHSSCTEISRRGYRVLCANNTNNKANTENDQNVETMLLEAKLGMQYLRKLAGVGKIVLFGHSGGGVLMSSYQGIAEGGLAACQGPEKIYKCSSALADLPAADGLMLIDSNYGTSLMTLFSLDPAITDDASGQKRNPALDLWNPQNGFDARGAKYTPEFTRRFQSGVGKREQALIKAAQERLKLIEAGQGRYSDDEPFVIPGANSSGTNNKFFAQDVRFLSHTQKPWPLLHKDGSITTQIVHTVRVPKNMEPSSSSYVAGSLKSTVRRFLSTNAIRVTDDFGFDESSIRGVDWASSYTAPFATVRTVKVPLLAMGMTGNWEFLAAEGIYDNAASTDKTIAFVEGANHVFTTCKPCEKMPGEFGDTVKTLYDYIDKWLSQGGRFL
jgi:hypothetical protein